MELVKAMFQEYQRVWKESTILEISNCQKYYKLKKEQIVVLLPEDFPLATKFWWHQGYSTFHPFIPFILSGAQGD